MNTETNFMSFENLTKLIEEHKKETHPYKKYEFDSTSYTLLLIDINNLIKENQELKSQLKGTTHCFDEEEHEKLKKQLEDIIISYTEEHNLRHNSDLKLDVLKTQQKEFIEWLEDKIQQQETLMAENQEKLYFLMYEDEKEDLKLYSRKAYTRRIILEEILQKYKEIIGGKHE